MAIVGLTGGIGSGKSTVANLFHKLGVFNIDMDDVARDVVSPSSPALEKIRSHFQPIIPNIIDHTGHLNRKALRHHIFENPEAKNWLENLLHPLIRQQTYSQLKANQIPYSLLVSPLIIEKKLPVDALIVVDVSTDQQIYRVILRDDTDASTTQKIIDTQVTRAERLQQADYVIDNNHSLKDTQDQVTAIHRQLTQRFS